MECLLTFRYKYCDMMDYRDFPSLRDTLEFIDHFENDLAFWEIHPLDFLDEEPIYKTQQPEES